MQIYFEEWPENTRIRNPLADYFKKLDLTYLTNRLENESVSLVHTTSELTASNNQTDWSLGRLQSWYAGRELSNLGNIVDFKADRQLQNKFRSTPVNQAGFSYGSGTYKQTNAYGIYKNEQT